MGALLTVQAGEAEAQKHKAENNSSKVTHFKHTHMISHRTQEDFFRRCYYARLLPVFWAQSLGRRRLLARPHGRAPWQSPMAKHHGYPPLVAISDNFIYKTLCAPTKTERDVTPTLML